MNKTTGKLLSVILVTTMVLSLVPAIIMTAKAQPPLPAPCFYFDPSSQSFSTSNMPSFFTETLYVATTGDTFTYQYEVDYDPTVLNCTGAAYTAVGKSQFFNGHTTVPTGPDLSVPGKVSGGETLLGTDVVHANTAGASIITMNFTIVGSPPVGGTLTSNITLNSANTFLLDPNLNTVPNVSDGIVAFTLTYAVPPPPVLTIVLPISTFASTTNWNGTTFTADVDIQGTTGWFLGNATTQLDYNHVLTSVTNVVFDPLWATTSESEITPGTLQFNVSSPTSVPIGTVRIATINFTIIDQGAVPPEAFGAFDVSTLHFHDFQLGSTASAIGYISKVTAVDGTITVFAYAPVSPPHLEVSSITIGPTEAAVGEFNTTVSLDNVASFQNIVGIQFRLSYNDSVLQPVAVTEGPFLGSFAALQPGSQGTFFQPFVEDPDGLFAPSDVLVGNLIFPNGTGQWNPPMLNGSGVVAIITFKLLLLVPLTTPLNIVDMQAVGLDNLVSQNIVPVALNPPSNGTVTITVNLPGRAIDLFGGAVNSGFSTLVGAPYLQFPAPYGGQGPNAPMDLVEPESLVYLNANVTYNGYAVQNKEVAFEVDYPNGTEYTKLTGVTDSNGTASVSFRMPWPSDNPESLFGIWDVTATAQLADVTINDSMPFEYNYLVSLTKVTVNVPTAGISHGQSSPSQSTTRHWRSRITQPSSSPR